MGKVMRKRHTAEFRLFSPSHTERGSRLTSSRLPAGPTQKHQIFASTMSMPTTDGRKNGRAASVASLRKIRRTIWDGAEPWRRWGRMNKVRYTLSLRKPEKSEPAKQRKN